MSDPFEHMPCIRDALEVCAAPDFDAAYKQIKAQQGLDAFSKMSMNIIHLADWNKDQQAQITTLTNQVERMREALKDIAYAKSWKVQNRPMELVSIAVQALTDAGGEG